MASKRVTKHPHELLDELGEEHVFWLYVEESRTVRELVAQLFEPHGDAEKPGVKEFYEWLHVEDGRWQRWQAAKRFKATFMAEDALEIGPRRRRIQRAKRAAESGLSEVDVRRPRPSRCTAVGRALRLLRRP